MFSVHIFRGKKDIIWVYWKFCLTTNLYNFLLTLEDKTLEREEEMLDMACVTDILDQNDAVESFDDALQSRYKKY